ncbi:MAG: hypothetical protein WC865_13640 [Bacteroidales bacterium]
MNDFIEKVEEMRRLQREYFRKRDPIILHKAKTAERMVDDLILEIENLNEPMLELWKQQ